MRSYKGAEGTLQFVCEELYYLVPSEQGDLVNLTIVLMIDNGFVVNFTV